MTPAPKVPVKPASPAPAAPVPIAWVTEYAFRQTVGGSILEFAEGQVIKDPVLAAKLLAADAPIEAITATTDLLQCPHCGAHFTVE